MSEKHFKDKVVVVTGGAGGIGWALCREFACHGAIIGLLDMDAQRVEASARALIKDGCAAEGVVCDVSREDECVSAIKKIIDRFGGIDVLINNAGITQRDAFVNTRIRVFKKVMDINFYGSLYCTKAAIDSILSRKGQIIIIESMAGVTPLLGRSGYSASKHALHGLFTTLRCEIKEAGAHVMIVCPGFIKTDLQSRALGGDGSVTTHPQSRVGHQQTPEQAAEAIYQGAVKRKKLLVLTWVGKIGYWISRIAPHLYERIMTNKFKSELERP